MKSVGIVRKVDELGRIVLPAELRNSLGIEKRHPLEIYVENEYIILKKYQPDCIFCGDVQDVSQYKGKNICQSCLSELKSTNNDFS